MAVVINGDTGITSVNGTAGAPSITGTDTDTGVVYGTNTVSISTGGAERVRVDSSGNVGVGVTPSAWATVVPAIELKNGVHFASLGTSAPIGYLGANTYYNGTNWIYKNSSQYATRYETNSNGAGAHAWFTAPNSGGSGAGTTATFTQAMTLDASGNLGVGTTSPSQRLHVYNNVNGTSFAWGNAARTGYLYQDANGVGITNAAGTGFDEGVYFDTANSATILYTQSSERARIDSSGNLLVGTTSSSAKISVFSGGDGIRSEIPGNGSSNFIAVRTSVSGSPYVLYNVSNAGFVGGITMTTTGTQFLTSSDYRLKEDVQPMQGALSTLSKLKPCTYTWKADGSVSQGFIAHELQAVVPEAVVGEKDAVDEDGNPKYQGIDTSFLVATLTAAIQEQQAIITQLQADVAALKGQA